MKKNMGTVDRVIRAFLIIIGFCPLYAPFGISTKKKDGQA